MWTMTTAKTSNDDNDNDKSKVVCVDCDKKTQKDLPNQTASASKGQPCALSYQTVTECMETNQGQITACAKEWQAFRQCHEDHKVKR